MICPRCGFPCHAEPIDGSPRLRLSCLNGHNFFESAPPPPPILPLDGRKHRVCTHCGSAFLVSGQGYRHYCDACRMLDRCGYCNRIKPDHFGWCPKLRKHLDQYPPKAGASPLTLPSREKEGQSWRDVAVDGASGEAARSARPPVSLRGAADAPAAAGPPSERSAGRAGAPGAGRDQTPAPTVTHATHSGTSSGPAASGPSGTGRAQSRARRAP